MNSFFKKFHINLLVIFIFLLAFNIRTTITQSLSSRFGFVFGIGFSFFSPDQLNDFIVYNLDTDKIENGITLVAGLEYKLFPHICIFSKVRYFTSSAKGEFIVTSPNSIHVVKQEYRIRDLPLSFGVSYNIRLNNMGLRVAVAAEYHMVQVSRTVPPVKVSNIPEVRTELVKNGLGSYIAAGPQWKISSLFSIGIQAGYRLNKVSGFKSTDMYLPSEFSVSLNGLFFEGMIKIHWSN